MAVSIVLVRGAFVDGSGWEGVYGILKKEGYAVGLAQNPTATLAADPSSSSGTPTPAP